MGVELASFTPSDPIVASTLPAGPSVVATRRGELTPDGIAAAHAAAKEWATAEGVALTGACWEIYGHMRGDPADFELLAGWPVRR